MTEFVTRKQIRLNGHDYSSPGYYFITVCSRNKENIFGTFVKNDIVVGSPLACDRDREMNPTNGIELSTAGKIIEKQWNKIPDEYANVELDLYVIMPNHIHGIILIIEPVRERTHEPVRERTRAQASRAPTTLSGMIRSFKSRSSMEYLNYIKEKNLGLSAKIWQRSFHDHIIRNEKSLHAIREYILSNPVNWEQDVENILNS